MGIRITAAGICEVIKEEWLNYPIERINKDIDSMASHIEDCICNMYSCSGNCKLERSAGFPMFSLITLFILISLIVLQPWSYIRAQ